MASSSSSTNPASHVATSFLFNPLTSNTPDQSRSGTVCPHCNQPIKEIKDSGDAFHTSLQKLFPGALELEEFVFETKQTLVPKGFYPHVNTLVCVGLCRDEITSPFEEEVEAMWGRAFITSVERPVFLIICFFNILISISSSSKLRFNLFEAISAANAARAPHAVVFSSMPLRVL